MTGDNSRFASDGTTPGLAGLSGYTAGDRTLRNNGGPNYMSGDDVKFVQKKVGVTPDGAYGPQTQAAVSNWQRRHDLTPSGVVDSATWAKIKGTPSFDLTSFEDTINSIKQAARNEGQWLFADKGGVKDPGGDLFPPNKSGGSHLGWWLGGGAVVVSLIGLAAAGNGKSDH